MKKVLLSAYACIPNVGSEEATGWQYASTLSQEQTDVHCLTQLKGKDAIDKALASGRWPNLTVHYVTIPDWVEQSYGRGLVGMYFHYLYWQWAASQVARKLDRQHNFDLVHHITYGSIQLGSFMYRLNKPFIFGPVSGGQQSPASMKQYFGSYWRREQMRSWVGTVLERINPAFVNTIKRADRVIVTNSDTYELARRYRQTGDIDKVLDGGIGQSFLPEGPISHEPGRELNALWIGRMLPRKALELTIHALSKVDPSVPIKLTIVGGKGDMVDLVPAYIEQYGVQDRINWVGHVSHNDVKQYLQQADVFFLTSLRDSGPHQLLEAMAYSLPVVTLNLHGQGEIVSDETGIRVPVGSPEQVTTDLAAALTWMWHHPTERQQMGQTAYRFALTQLWDKKVKLFADNWYPALATATAQQWVREPELVELGQFSDYRLG